MRTITLTKQQQQLAKGWLEAQFLMSIQDNMCCRCHATVDKETHNFNSHADHKQDPLMRDRASSTLKKNSIRFCTKTQLYSAQQIIKSREFSYYLAGVGSGNEQFQSLSFQLCEPSIAVLTPDHSFTARRAPAAWGRWSSPKTRGAAQRAGRFSPNSWWDGSRRSREGPRWGDPWAWGRGARGARHGAGSLWGRTCARAGGFIISFSVPCVWKERRRFGWGSIRHLGKKGRMKRTWHWKRRRRRIKLLLMPIEIKYNNLAVHIDSFWVSVLCFFELNLHYVKNHPTHLRKNNRLRLAREEVKKKACFELCSFKAKLFSSTQPDSVSQLFCCLISCLWLCWPHSCGWIKNKWEIILGMNKSIPVPHVQAIYISFCKRKCMTCSSHISQCYKTQHVSEQTNYEARFGLHWIFKQWICDQNAPIKHRCDGATAQVGPTTGCCGYPMWRLH